MKTCFLFPGQGSQYSGMGSDLWEAEKPVRDLFELASDASGRDLRKLLFEADENELKETSNTQIAVTLVNMAAATTLERHGIRSDGCAGFSLGEYSALWDAGVLSTEDAIKAVQRRGEIMSRAASRLPQELGPPGMAAVLGLNIDEARPVLEELENQDLYLANHSSPSQIVISGTGAALQKAEKLFEEAGAMKYVTLKVSGPFHSPLMVDAREELADYLRSVRFSDPEKYLVANATGDVVNSGDEARRCCVEQIVSTVRWVTSEEKLLGQGYDRYVEPGPGKIISGLWKSFYKEIRCRPAGTLEAIHELTGSAE